MMGFQLMGKLPFKEVFLHAMIRDKYGRKMSKSLGNVIDPLDVIHGISLAGLQEQLHNSNLDPKEIKKAQDGQKVDYPDGIPECGTDALRFALCAYTSQGRDINLDVLRVQGYRFFCNKLWNATKFALNGLGEGFQPTPTMQLCGGESQMDLWILSRLADTVSLCNTGFETYDFPMATTALYNFWLYDLCDIYLECLKPVLYGSDEASKAASRSVLYTCLDAGLRLISPFMPFISEELYQRLPRRADDYPSICISPYPVSSDVQDMRNTELEKRVEFTMSVVRSIRSMRADYQLTPKTKTDLFLRCSDEGSANTLEGFLDLVIVLGSGAEVKVVTTQTPPEGCAIATVSDKCEVHMMLRGLIDIGKEITKLEEKKSRLGTQLTKLKQAAEKPDYSKVPENVRTLNSEKMGQLDIEIEQLTSAITSLLRLK